MNATAMKLNAFARPRIASTNLLPPRPVPEVNHVDALTVDTVS